MCAGFWRWLNPQPQPSVRNQRITPADFQDAAPQGAVENWLKGEVDYWTYAAEHTKSVALRKHWQANADFYRERLADVMAARKEDHDDAPQ